MSISLINDLGDICEISSGLFLEQEEFKSHITKKSIFFKKIGVKEGQKIILLHSNSINFFIDLFSLWLCGGCVICIDPKSSTLEIQNILSHSGASFLVTDKEFKAPSVRVINTEDRSYLNYLESDFIPSMVKQDSDALILYTSGTTGNPKGVLHTHRSLLNKINSLKGSVDINAFRRTLNILPTHFGHGLICNCLFPLLTGNTLFIAEAFSVSSILEVANTIEDKKITFMSSVPTIWKTILGFNIGPQKKFSTLERIHCGSSPLSEDLYVKISKLTGCENIFNTYGITEIGSWVSGADNKSSPFKSGKVGRGWNCEFLISHHEDGKNFSPISKKEVSTGEVGNVWVRTPDLMKEYFNNDEQTFLATSYGWFYTGDLGYIDIDGSLILTGRKRNEINCAGMKITPEDIDIVFEKCHLVKEVCTFGYPDELRGEAIGIALVLNPNATLREAQDWAKVHINEHKLPHKWFVVDELIKNSRGKINRESLMKKLTEV